MGRLQPILAHDPTVGIDHHRPDDRFNPVRAGDLVAALAADTQRFGSLAAALPAFAAALERVIVQETAALERDLAQRYNSVNPDRDTIAVGDLASARTPAAYADLAARLDYLLAKANFARFSHVDIRSVLRAANSYGLRVRLHPDRIEHLAVWVRGRAEVELSRRTLRKPRGETRRLPVYRRLVVVARLKDDPNVQLKMFKDIPMPDVEALLPHAEVEMSWSDRIKLMGGGAGMLGSTATKLLELATGAVVLSRLLWVIMFGAGVLCVRTFLGYRNVRARRDLQRTSNLYYQNLANNAGVIHSLISMIAQEDVKEALLAYVFCQVASSVADAGPGATPARLSDPIRDVADLTSRVETYLDERFGVHFTFDVEDARQTLLRLNLCEDAVRFRVLPLYEAIARLDEHWLARRTEDHHVARAGAAARQSEPPPIADPSP